MSFDVVVWDPGPASIRAGGRTMRLESAPFSRPCEVTARLVDASTTAELEGASCRDQVLLVHGELAREQLLPKGFPFVDAPEHRRILQLLETARPAAIIAATGHGGGFSGGVRPFPLIEDADVGVPSAAIDVVHLDALRAWLGRDVQVSIVSDRHRGTATQLFATTGPPGPGTVAVLAHIDSKAGSPGALDNAGGVAALLRIAELLAECPPAVRVDLVPINGEDHYAVPGERLYLERQEGRWGDLVLGVNIDGIGSLRAPVAVSTYGCPPAVEAAVEAARASEGLVAGDPWFEGDHGLFLQHGRPAIALTSADARVLTATVTHTPRDRRELVDEDAIEATARFVRRLIADPALRRAAAPG